MDRRDLLRAAALIGGGAVAGAALRPPQRQWLRPLDLHERAVAEQRTYANEVWGDPALQDTRVVWKVQTDEKLIALTFDDGPRPANTSAVLDVLTEKKVRATFNVVGARALAHPELIRRELAGWHEIGNHTWSHRNFAFLDRRQTIDEVRRGDEAIERVTGRRTSVFRPPKGNLTGSALAEAARLGYQVVLWSLKLHEAAFDAEGNARYVAENVTPGTILLAHDVGNPQRRIGLACLPTLIDLCRAQGYTFVTTSELLQAGRPVYVPAAG